MSGHSKWANIKNKKSKADAQRGKAFTKATREIMVAVRQGGGDPAGNFRLRIAIQNAKAVNMPIDNINRAIQRALGGGENENLEEIVYEGYGPGGAAVMLEIMTDNRNRTAGDIRHLFAKHGGNLGETGCVSWMFNKKGVVTIEDVDETDEEELMLAALEAGAEDMRVEDGIAEIITEPDALESVTEGLKNAGIEFTSASVTMVPQTTVKLEGEEAQKMLRLLNALEDHDDVQEVYSNVEIDEDEL